MRRYAAVPHAAGDGDAMARWRDGAGLMGYGLKIKEGFPIFTRNDDSFPVYM